MVLTFGSLSSHNYARQKLCYANAHDIKELGLCLSEEVGELNQAILGLTGAKARKAHLTAHDAGSELADIVIYADLAAQKLGLDLGELVRAKFNSRSEKVGYKGKI